MGYKGGIEAASHHAVEAREGAQGSFADAARVIETMRVPIAIFIDSRCGVQIEPVGLSPCQAVQHVAQALVCVRRRSAFLGHTNFGILRLSVFLRSGALVTHPRTTSRRLRYKRCIRVQHGIES